VQKKALICGRRRYVPVEGGRYGGGGRCLVAVGRSEAGAQWQCSAVQAVWLETERQAAAVAERQWQRQAGRGRQCSPRQRQCRWWWQAVAGRWQAGEAAEWAGMAAGSVQVAERQRGPCLSHAKHGTGFFSTAAMGTRRSSRTLRRRVKQIQRIHEPRGERAKDS